MDAIEGEALLSFKHACNSETSNPVRNKASSKFLPDRVLAEDSGQFEMED